MPKLKFFEIDKYSNQNNKEKIKTNSKFNNLNYDKNRRPSDNKSRSLR